MNTRKALRSLACFASLTLFATALRADFVPEQLTVRPLPAGNAHRIYVSDPVLNHLVDGRLHVLDGDSLKYLGVISTGFAGFGTHSPDRGKIYVATTYYSRLTRGERTDVVEIYDAGSLKFETEIPIPPVHAQGLAYKGLIRASGDGRWLFVQNATPATSVTVVDLTGRKFAGEIDLPGCWTVLPSARDPRKFSTLCGDGTVLTVTLDAEGKAATQKREARLFDPDADPIFVQAESDGDRHLFVSFLGKVHAVDLGSDAPRVEAPWSLLGPADVKQGWRPGGYQLIAWHRKSGRLFVAMHPKGREGSHKNPATEIWVFDLATQKRIARLPGANAIAITVSQDERPLLFAIDGATMQLVSFDAGAKPKLRQRAALPFESAVQIETH